MLGLYRWNVNGLRPVYPRFIGFDHCPFSLMLDFVCDAYET